MIKITFPDGSVREYEAGVTGLQIAESISSRLAQDVLACGVNGEIVELNRPINEDASVVLYKWEDAEGKHAFWHTSAHLMAEAMQELYPGMQFGIGPAIENGFYYDVMPPAGTVIRESDFAGIEKKMLELAQRKEPVVRAEISKADALKFFGERGQTYKNELIEDLEDGHISTYTQGAFTDLCRGPHLMNTGVIKAVKVTAVSSAYWRGDEKRPQMTRVYAISFPKKKMLDEYLTLLEEAKKRDHRKIGKEMELFMFSERVGKGLPMWLPKGTALRLRLEDFLKKAEEKGKEENDLLLLYSVICYENDATEITGDDLATLLDAAKENTQESVVYFLKKILDDRIHHWNLQGYVDKFLLASKILVLKNQNF